MTAIELRMFVESLPREGPLNLPALTFTDLAQRANLEMASLKEVLAGRRNLTKTMITRLLPVMREYGYPG